MSGHRRARRRHWISRRMKRRWQAECVRFRFETRCVAAWAGIEVERVDLERLQSIWSAMALADIRR